MYIYMCVCRISSYQVDLIFSLEKKENNIVSSELISSFSPPRLVVKDPSFYFSSRLLPLLSSLLLSQFIDLVWASLSLFQYSQACSYSYLRKRTHSFFSCHFTKMKLVGYLLCNIYSVRCEMQKQ